MKMKLVAIALSGVLLSSSAAFGMDFDPKFYVGGEAQMNNLKNGKKFVDENNKSLLGKKTVPGGSLLLGTKLNENLGLEAGYTLMGKSKRTFSDKSSTTTKPKNAYIDALGYVPVSNEVDLIGSVGVGRLSTKVQDKAANGQVIPLSTEDKKFNKAKAGVRVGAGAQYKFDQNLGARMMVRYQKGNKVIKDVKSVGLGVFYQF